MHQIANLAKPRTVAEALASLAGDPTARPLAGGTDLLVAFREKGLRCDTAVDLKNIPELHGIEQKDGILRLGATTTVHELAGATLVTAILPPLAEAAGLLGSYQLRQRATVGGNLCNASPAADTACPLLVGDARAVLAGPDGQRTVPLNQFLLGPGKTALRRGEILVAVECPVPGAAAPGLRYAGAYIKLGPRRAMDIAIVNVAVLLGIAADGTCQDARIALGSVGPTAYRVPSAEAALVGQVLRHAPGATGASGTTGAALAAAAAAAQAAARPISDIRASADYRSEMVRNLVERALEIVLERVNLDGR